MSTAQLAEERAEALRQAEMDNTRLRGRVAVLEDASRDQAEAVNETNRLLVELLEEKTQLVQRLGAATIREARWQRYQQSARSILREVRKAEGQPHQADRVTKQLGRMTCLLEEIAHDRR